MIAVGLPWLADPKSSNSGRDGMAAVSIYRKYGGGRKLDCFVDRRKKGPKPLRLVFVGQHEGEDRRGRVAGSDVEFQGVHLSGDDDRESNLFALTYGTDREFGHGGNIVADTGDILTGMLQGFLDYRPHRRGAGKGVFPVLVD